jgi:RHS repeat-associated protein
VNGGVAVVTTYTYDAADRLATSTRAGVTTTYTYDLNSNRLSLTVGGGTPNAATYDAQDRLTAYGPVGTQTAYTYLPDGQLASRTPFGGATVSYSYDELGNLLSVATVGAPASQIDYTVDGLGRRVERKKGGTVTQRWLYQDSLRPVAELDGTNTPVSRFVYAGGVAPEYMIKGGTLYRFVKDQLGSVRLVVDQTGTITQRIDYDPWGVVTADTNPGFQPFGFAGGLYDPDTKLVRFGNRDYDAEIGRWTARDPASFGGGSSNLYEYAFSSPVNLADASGAIPTPPNRDPDYRAFSVGAGASLPGWLSNTLSRVPGLKKYTDIGYNGSIIIDRYGHVYVAKGSGAGRVKGASASAVNGWLMTHRGSCPPTSSELMDFLTGWSISLGMGAGFGGNWVRSMSNPSKTALELGVMTPGAGGNKMYGEYTDVQIAQPAQIKEEFSPGEIRRGPNSQVNPFGETTGK